jgi:TrmH family RNA methyltransferase
MTTLNDVKYYAKLKLKKYRDREGKFLIEGIHLIEECLKSEKYRNNLEKIFVREDFQNDKAFEIIRSYNHIADIEIIDEIKFSKITETVTSQGLIGVVSKLSGEISKVTSEETSIIKVVLDSINDPGNLGTILRNCHWFGADEVIVGINSADIYNSKVLRSSQGAVFNLNISNETEIENELVNLKAKGFEIIITDLKAENYLSEFTIEKNKKFALVFGNEASGISENITVNKNYKHLKIKGFSDCESLNVSVTSGIFLYTFRK